VQEVGLEPTRGCPHRILSPVHCVTGRCRRLQDCLTFIVFALPALPTVAVCCTGLVSKLVLISVSLIHDGGSIFDVGSITVGKYLPG
jgi:hypothetical protein